MKQASATLIGAFVLGAVALIVAGILFFGSGTLFKKSLGAVSYFSGSVAGLQTGAAVTYRGVRVGEVKSIGIQIDPGTTRSMVRVDMELVPQAVRVYGEKPLSDEKSIQTLTQRGLSARLVMQSFVTGQLQVELDFRPEMEASRLGGASDVPEIPTVPSPFQALTEQLQTLDVASTVAALDRTLDSLHATLTNAGLKQTLDELPALLADIGQTVKGVDAEVKGLSAAGRHAMADTAAALQKTLTSVERLADNLDRESASTLALTRGTLQNANTAIDDVRGTLRNANTAIDGVNVLLDPQGRTIMQMQDAVEDLAATAARVRDLTERVDRDPTVLIRGQRR
jgi:paraquat-inducible protein B